MTAVLPKLITGDVYPGEVVREDPFYKIKALPSRVVFSYLTDRPGGKPIKHEVVKAKPLVPRATGDERHGGMLEVLQKALQSKDLPSSAPMAQAQEQYRDWR